MSDQNYNSMEHIWEKIPKQKDGQTIRYIAADLDYLYFHGFVNSRLFSLKQWKTALGHFKQDDGSYVLNKEQFLALAPFRYTGPSHEVFDVNKLPEGPWTKDDLKKLYDESVAVASDITEKMYWTLIDSFRDNPDNMDQDGNLYLNNTVKAGLFVAIEQFPSPRRRLEQEVDRLREQRSKDLSANQVQRDKSGFNVGSTKQEDTLDALKKFEGKGAASKTAEQTTVSSEEELDLKKLRKPTGKFYG